MRNRSFLFMGVLLVLVAAAIAAWALLEKTHAPGQQPTPVASSTPSLVGQAIYTNGSWGFSLVYPASARVKEGSFDGYYHLQATWRANLTQDATGTPVVEIVPYETKSDHSYPRYFATLVRVGVSTSTAEVRRCEQPTADVGETQLPDRSTQGIEWKAFAFRGAGMMQYVQGVSYRTVHAGACYALEKIEVGSDYREDAPSRDDVSQATLDAAYEALDPIVGSFRFAR